jgi:hypothetical protein
MTFAEAIAFERSREAAFRASHARAAHRHRGVCLSGMGPDAYRPRTDAQIEAAAAEWVARADTPKRRAMAAVIAAQNAARAANDAARWAELECLRGAISRGMADAEAMAIAECLTVKEVA